MMQMSTISIIRAIIAVTATFAMVAGVTAAILQYGLKLLSKGGILTCRQEKAILLVAVLTAILLIPFYYIPD